jgi:hypothetical protein
MLDEATVKKYVQLDTDVSSFHDHCEGLYQFDACASGRHWDRRTSRMAILDDCRKDFAYLEGLSNKGQLQVSNSIYQRPKNAARHLSELQRGLNTLRVDY